MTELEIEKALLISTHSSSNTKDECNEHLEELKALADTYGITVAEKVPIYLRSIDASTYITKGKLEEMVELSRDLGVNVIIIDEEISPAQQRNLEEAFQKSVMDRTELILAVFEQRAQTKEARLQVELAQTKYELPRLKRLWTHLSRQAGTGGAGGAGGYTKGEGEKQIEIDKRLLRRRQDRLNEQIKHVKHVRKTQRQRRKREGIPTFALVGYTNAGKSTLLNALTDADAFVEDKLFATLDTTTRKFTLPNNQEVLVIDTVGFIRKLPHLVVAAFKSTLEESLEADILLHVVDVQSPLAEEHAETTFQVLEELKSEKKSIITVFNKADLVENPLKIHKLKIKYPKNVTISAKEKDGFDDLYSLMWSEIKNLRQEAVLRISQAEYHLVSKLLSEAEVLSKEYDENDIILQVRLSNTLAGKLEQYFVK